MKEDYEELLHLETEAWETELEATQLNLDLECERTEVLRGIVDYYRTRSEEFRQKGNRWASSYKDLVEQIKDGALHQEIQAERNFWMDMSDKITALANGVLEEVLDKLEAANGAVSPWVTPDSIQKFLECCNDLVKELRSRIREH